MELDEIKAKIKATNEQLEFLEKEKQCLIAEEIAERHKHKISHLQPGMILFDNQHKRIGRLLAIKPMFSEIQLECKGFEDDMHNEGEHLFLIDIDRAEVVPIPDAEFQKFFENISARKTRFHEALKHASNIKSTCESYYRKILSQYLPIGKIF